MKLYRLGTVSWQDSQLLYHALPRLGREGLNLLSPGSPYVCTGYHQDVEQEVDVEFCRENNIPIFRREVGGGAVYLDGAQLFWQLIIRKNNPLIDVSSPRLYACALINRRCGNQKEHCPHGPGYGSQNISYHTSSVAD